MLSIDDLRRKRGTECEHCHTRPATQRHHVFVRRNKRKSELDNERNLMLVCSECHISGAVDGYDVSRAYWPVQLGRYPDLREWYEGLRLKVKEAYE